MKFYRLAPFLALIGSLFLYPLSLHAHADNHTSVMIDDDVEVEILQIGKPASTSIIWFACNQGDETAEFETARKMLVHDYQFHFPDMLSAHFLSPTPSNIAKLKTSEIVTVVQHILQNTTSESVFLIGGARAAVPVIKALSDPSIKQAPSKLKGALLITPRINRKTPEPGAEPVYIKEAGLSSHPIRILEGERTPNRWALPHLASTLSQHGSPIQTDLIKGVRGFFYLRSEQTPAEVNMTQKLDQIIHHNIEILGAINP